MWSIFFLAFIGGFAALLTPCVFPMIPMTVSYFTKQSKTKAEGKRNAILYGISAPVLIAIILHISNNKKIMGEYTNSKPANILGFAALISMTLAAIALLYLQF